MLNVPRLALRRGPLDSLRDIPFAARAGAARDAAAARPRRGLRRSTVAPVPLLAAIAMGAGVGLAYVSQSASLTQTTYQVSSLTRQQQTLQAQDQRLGDQLDRLRSTERIAAAAAGLGMQPPSSFAFVASAQSPVSVPPATAEAAAPAPGGPLQRVVAALRGDFGTTEAEAAGR